MLCYIVLIVVGTAISSVSFDYSGLYLAVGGGFCGSEENDSFVTPAGAKISSYGVRLFHSKDWSFVSVSQLLHCLCRIVCLCLSVVNCLSWLLL